MAVLVVLAVTVAVAASWPWLLLLLDGDDAGDDVGISMMVTRLGHAGADSDDGSDALSSPSGYCDARSSDLSSAVL